jgi:hypothetical protein
MDMHVRDGLAGGRAIIDADIEAVRAELRVENPFLVPDQIEQRLLLPGREVEKRTHVSIRDREGMTPRHRIAVADGKRQGIRRNNPVLLYRGIGDSREFQSLRFRPEDLSPQNRDIWVRYLGAQATMLSDSVLSFDTVHDRVAALKRHASDIHPG